MEIRVPLPAEAEVIARNHQAAWQVGYRGLIADALLDGLDLQRRIDRWHLALADPTMTVRVVDAGDGPVGHVTVGAATRPGTTDGEVLSLYVNPDHWGHGYGRALLHTGRKLLADQGYCHPGLWMVRGNTRALALYESDGWALEGTEEPFVLDGVDYGTHEVKLHHVASGL